MTQNEIVNPEKCQKIQMYCNHCIRAFFRLNPCERDLRALFLNMTAGVCYV
jgi:hypothetical protein